MYVYVYVLFVFLLQYSFQHRVYSNLRVEYIMQLSLSLQFRTHIGMLLFHST